MTEELIHHSVLDFEELPESSNDVKIDQVQGNLHTSIIVYEVNDDSDDSLLEGRNLDNSFDTTVEDDHLVDGENLEHENPSSSSGILPPEIIIVTPEETKLITENAVTSTDLDLMQTENLQSHHDDTFPVASELAKVDELNILLLGPGIENSEKNAFINGLYNYTAYKTLEDADAVELSSLVPMEFKMLDAQYNEITVGFSEETRINESDSGTPSYKFNVGNKLVRIIDSPPQFDQQNLKNTLQQLQSVGKIHGILILLKPNVCPNDKIKLHLQQIMSHLHQDAVKNKCFCFINTRNYFYRPGSSLQSLQKLFGQYELLSNSENSKNIVYCFDDESVLFLTALKKKIGFTSVEYSNFSTSWRQSSDEGNRLFQYLSTLQPINTESCTIIKEAKKLIELIQKPLVDISCLINENAQRIEGVLENRTSVDDLSSICPPIKTLMYEELPYFRTVCMSSPCNQSSLDSKISTATHKHYTKVCHDKCRVYSYSLFGWSCSCFTWGMTCKTCKCSFSQHVSVNFGTVVVEKKFELISEELLSKKAQVEENKIVVEDVQRCIEELQNEKIQILKTVALLTRFLQKNVSNDDDIQDYIKCWLQQENETNEFLTKGINNSNYDKNEEIKTIEDIFDVLQSLYQLTYMGPSIKSLVLQASSKKNMTFQLKSVYSPPPKAADEKSSGVLERLWKFGKRRCARVFVGYFGSTEGQTTNSAAPLQTTTDNENVKLDPYISNGKRIKLASLID